MTMTTSRHDTQPVDDAITGLATRLANAGHRLCTALASVRDEAAVDSYFGAFLGSPALAEARQLGSYDGRRAKRALRQSLSALYAGAGTWGDALAKPYGYPGDYALLEIIYDRDVSPSTRTAWGSLVDVWSTQMVLPRAVRARKNVLRTWLEAFLDARPCEAQRARLLSIASGAARELRELDDRRLGRGAFTLLDHDARALAFASGSLGGRAVAPDVVTVETNAFHAEADLTPVAARGPYDVIYSFGLFDYLPDELLVQCINRFAPYLDSQGKFLFCLKDRRYYDAWLYDWLYDWRFVPRTIEDGHALAARAGFKLDEQIVIEGGVVGVFVCSQS